MNKSLIVRYSESFKLQVLKEYSENKMSKNEICLKYDIRGGATLNNWLRKYNQNHLINRVVKIESLNEKNKLKELQKENQKLKNALADAHIKQVTSESFIEAACEEFGLTVEELKKKFGKR